MRYEIVLAPEAVEDFKHLSARERAIVRNSIEKYLRFSPGKTTRTRIKRLRGLSHPQFRLRITDIRVFYDVAELRVEILAIIPKSRASDWLAAHGELENETG